MEWGSLSYVAVATALISLCIRWRFPTVPKHIASAGVAMGLTTLAMSVSEFAAPFKISIIVNATLLFGMLDYWLSRSTLANATEGAGANLRLIFHGDNRNPTCLRSINVATWAAYGSPIARFDGVGEDGKQEKIFESSRTWVIFIAYDLPTEVSQIVASLNAPGIPPYTVPVSTKRACMIVFGHDIPAGDLEIDVRV
jgi:hypothetical protein